jgi:GWxTD domain-containing protein
MTSRARSAALLAGALLFLCLLGSAKAPSPADWTAWLDEVDPIMTRTERAVFKALRTDDERRQFQSLFWKVRDATPGTPENEFKSEFYARRDYAERRLGGARTDRGRVYIILGKPAENQSYAGLEKVVDCELWVYRGEGRGGLPPLMDLLFYRPNDLGEYKLYYPGSQTPADLLASPPAGRVLSPQAAYRSIAASYPELARASLAVIPDEADSAFPSALNSSGQTIGLIFSLPDREVEGSYLRRFTAPEGAVEVEESARQIAGQAAVFLTENGDVTFLNYALMPDRISTARTPDGLETAHLVFHLRLEDGEGRTVFQQDKEIRLRLDGPKAEAMRRQKLVFNDLAPVIEGTFRAHLTFTNRTSGEFFVEEREVVVGGGAPPLVIGYQVKEAVKGAVVPFSQDGLKVLFDPRSLYSRQDSLEGLVRSDAFPELALVDREKPGPEIAVRDVTGTGATFRFRLPLADVAPGRYDLVIKKAGREVARHVVYVLSFPVARPIVFERTEPLSYLTSLPFAVGQEYLNTGKPDRALEWFGRLPAELRNNATLPVIARAHYLRKDYARVIELLAPDTVEKTFVVLTLLGNASLEVKDLRRAAACFEAVRTFGDTAEANNTLGAIYFSLGEKDRAQACWERAKKLVRPPESPRK